MNEITLHPNVYATGRGKGLVHLLENIWVHNQTPGDGELFIISGFANYNGGVRFYDTFRNHINNGGKITAIFGGSTSSRLTSKQVVKELIDIGVLVSIVNRKRLLHAKCYGSLGSNGQKLIISSGNFTGPGMSQNVEMSIMLDNSTLSNTNFDWLLMRERIFEQKWDFYRPSIVNDADPSWSLLYDEKSSDIKIDETEEVTLVLILGHADTARINAEPGDKASLGTQYFWLSKDCYDFFPPLTIRNARGQKATYSCLINMEYKDIGITDNECRVTFEAENNLDFRLGTGKLRNTKIAKEGDLAIISRVTENDYVLRIISQNSNDFQKVSPFATSFIGHQGKKYGFLANSELEKILNIKL